MLLQHGLSSEPPDHSFALKRHCGVAISGLSGVSGLQGVNQDRAIPVLRGLNTITIIYAPLVGNRIFTHPLERAKKKTYLRRPR